MTRLSKFTAGLMGATALVAVSSPAFAVGTEAGTSVANQFTLTYDTGTQTNTITNDGVGGNDDPTTFVVDRVVNLTVVGSTTPDNAPGDTDVATVFTVTNLGNDEQSYLLFTELGDVTDFGLTDSTPAIEYYVAPSGTTCDATVPATATVYDGTAATVPVVPADSVLCVYVNQDIAQDATDGQSATIDLLATTTDTGTIDPVTLGGVNDPDTVQSVAIEGAPGPHTADGTDDGSDSATSTYVVGAANVTAIKEVALVSQDGSDCGGFTTPALTGSVTQMFIPGACVEYTITVSNAGTGDATDIDITDILPSEISFTAAEVVAAGWATAPGAPTNTPNQPCNDVAASTCDQVQSLNGVLSGVATSGDPANSASIRIRGTIRSTGATL